MFGQALFAEVPFSEMGNPPHVETGWIKDCKDPCADAGWTKRDRNIVDTLACDANTNNWTPNK